MPQPFSQGGGVVNGGLLTMETSLLSGNIAPEGAERYLAAGSELVYVLPAPLGHYLDGVVLCKEQSCKVDPTCLSSCNQVVL